MRLGIVVLCLLLFFTHPLCTTGLWWAVGNTLTFDQNRICRKAKRLSGKQQDLCKKEPEIIEAALLGSKEHGLGECRHQMKLRKWNCTTKSLGRVLLQDTRETAFANAITSAGVTFQITSACSAGSLLQCGCDNSSNSIIQQTKNATWLWGGCGDNVHFGYIKSIEFIDTQEKRRSDIKSLITQHNNEAGRLAVKLHMRKECKCHGLSGTCTLKTCWKRMPNFRDVGNRLKELFNGAIKVTGANNGKTLLPINPTIKAPTVTDLVYSVESPNFCEPDRKVGSIGTAGRVCNSTSEGVEGCQIMCCNRGFTDEIMNRTYHCRCRFKWCCVVECDICTKNVTISRCNGYS
uniref:Protein Wnt n=1 Tax=Himerometra robustipinna TaxID=706653 RepID=A0A5B8GWA6_9ECHI|nr:Wnt6 [Himerometra robustipinna]